MKIKPMGGVIPPTPNPWVWRTEDSAQRAIWITVSWVPITRLISAIQVDRDADCAYTKIIVGVGPDGTPDTSPKTMTVPAGTTVLLPVVLALLAGSGLATVDDCINTQVTAA